MNYQHLNIINKQQKSKSINPLIVSVNPRVQPDWDKKTAGQKTNGYEKLEVPFEAEALSDLVRRHVFVPAIIDTGYRQADNITHFQAIVIDFDQVEPKQVHNWAKYKENGLPFSSFGFTTRSYKAGENDKHRLIIPVSQPIPKDVYAGKLKDHFINTDEPFFRGICDKASFSVSQCFVASPNAEIAFHPRFDGEGNAILFDWTAIPDKPVLAKPHHKNKKQLADETHTLSVDTPFTTDKGEVVTIATITKHTRVYCPFCDPEKRGNPQIDNAFLDFNEHDSPYMHCSSENKTYWFESMSEIEIFLRKHYQFRRDIMRNQIQSFSDNSWNDIDDVFLNSILRKVQKEGIEISKERLWQLINSDFVEPVDVVHNYLDRLSWDGSQSIKALAKTVTLKDPQHQIQFETYLRKWLVATVAMQYDHEQINDTALVFVGGQGIGKTTWQRLIVPDIIRERHFAVTKKLGGDKDSENQLADNFVILLDELATLRKVEIDELKSTMSMKEIKNRLPYDRTITTRRRRCAFLGNTNQDTFLTDTTGTRRFICFEVTALNWAFTSTGLNLDMVWAEAVELYKAKFRYWYDQAEIEQLNRLNDTYRVISPIEEMLTDLLSQQGTYKTFMTVTDINRRLNEKCSSIKVDDSTSRKIGQVLKAKGYQKTQKRVDGSSPRYGYELPILNMNPSVRFVQEMDWANHVVISGMSA